MNEEINLWKTHFSLHSMDFDYIAELKGKLSKPGKGKGCVNVPFNKPDEKSILFQAIDDIIKRKVTRIYGGKNRDSKKDPI